MKRLPKPDFDSGEVYMSCVSSISDLGRAARFTAAKLSMIALAQQYGTRATANELYLFPASPWGAGAELVLGELTKNELTDLYTNHMSRRDQPSRAYYDRLLLLAPLSKCPYCGFGQVTTLDHFLSKAYYPYFSVLPINLVPVCSDCNRFKGAVIFNDGNQIPHPYFEGELIEKTTWLHATINETVPATATFSVVAPKSWPEDLTRRIGNYVHDLKLVARFAIEAASELVSLSDYLGQIKSSQLIGEHLCLVSRMERLHRRNSWKAALYEALSVSTWYRDGGYRRSAN